MTENEKEEAEDVGDDDDDEEEEIFDRDKRTQFNFSCFIYLFVRFDLILYS